MTVKEFLRHVRTLDRRVDAATERTERLRARLEAGRMSRITGMPRGGSGDWTITADSLIMLEQRENAEIREMIRWKMAAKDAIARVSASSQREVLELYYLNGYTWPQVARYMGYKDVRWVHELHGRALKKVQVPKEFLEKAL